jgi:hypothetical protein
MKNYREEFEYLCTKNRWASDFTRWNGSYYLTPNLEWLWIGFCLAKGIEVDYDL